MPQVVRGSLVLWENISSAAGGVVVLQANPKRVGLFIEAAAGNAADSLAVSFDDPALTLTGTKQGLLLSGGDQYVEPSPNANQGRVYIRSLNGTEDVSIREDVLAD